MWTVVRLLFATTTVRLCSASPGPLRPASCRHPVLSLLSCRRIISDGPPVMGRRSRAERDKSKNRAETASRDSQRRTELPTGKPRERRERQERPRTDRPGRRQKEGNEGGRHKVSSSESPRRKLRKRKRNEKLSSVVHLANSRSHPLSSPRQNERKHPIRPLTKRSRGDRLQKKYQNQEKSSHRDPRKWKRPPSGSSSGEMSEIVSRRLPTAGKEGQETSSDDLQMLAVIERAGKEASERQETSSSDAQVLAVIERAGKEAAERQESPSAGVQLLAAIERAGLQAAKREDQQIADRGSQQPNRQNVPAASQQNMPSLSQQNASSASQQNASSASQHVSASQQKVSSANLCGNAPQRTSKIEVSGEEMLNEVRVWETVASRYPRHHVSGPGYEFTMVSYNVLSQYLFDMHPELYEGARPEDTAWGVRGPRIWAQLMFLQPDVVCLQEVEEGDIKTFWRPRCDEAGFGIVYKKRTGGDKRDGCAILFRQSRFDLGELATVEYHQPNCRALDRDNVGVVVRLSGPCGDLVVACTHLLYNPKRHDVKLAQTALLLAEVDRLAWCGRQQGYLPILLAGDLNLEPLSPVYEFLRTGWFQYGGMSRKVLTPFGGGERLSSPLLPPELGISASCRHVAVQIRRCRRPPESERDRRRAEVGLLAVRHSERRHPPPPLPLEIMAQEAASGCLAHGLRLASVYGHRTPAGSEVTTKQRRWLTVDYIFHSVPPPGCVRLELTSRLALPTDSLCSRLAPYPSAALPSDHLPLAARFRMVPAAPRWQGRYS